MVYSGVSACGDGCVFLFGSANDGVAAAVAAQRALTAEPWPGGTAVRVRMAIHAGEIAGLGDELFGMARVAGDPAERWRKAATNQIRRALERIRTGHPALARHLDNALRTGVFCSYVPEQPITWRL